MWCTLLLRVLFPEGWLQGQKPVLQDNSYPLIPKKATPGLTAHVTMCIAANVVPAPARVRKALRMGRPVELRVSVCSTLPFDLSCKDFQLVVAPTPAGEVKHLHVAGLPIVMQPEGVRLAVVERVLALWQLGLPDDSEAAHVEMEASWYCQCGTYKTAVLCDCFAVDWQQLVSAALMACLQGS